MKYDLLIMLANDENTACFSLAEVFHGSYSRIKVQEKILDIWSKHYETALRTQGKLRLAKLWSEQVFEP